MNETLFYYLIVLFAILINALAIYLAQKNKHRIVEIILIINILLSIFMSLPAANLLPYLYFFYLIIRLIYNRYLKNNSTCNLNETKRFIEQDNREQEKWTTEYFSKEK